MDIANTHKKANTIKCKASIKLLKLVYLAWTLFPSPLLLCHHRHACMWHTKSINSFQEYKSILYDVDKKQDSHSPLTYLFFKNKSMVQGFGTWMQNNGLMRQRLSSLRTLIFIESRKSDTREDSLTFSHIRFLLLNTITVRQWLN